VGKFSKIRVIVSGVSALKEILGTNTSVILDDGSSVGDLIARIEELFGSPYRKLNEEGLTDSITRRFKLTVNGEILSPTEDSDKPLRNGDTILFFQLTGS